MKLLVVLLALAVACHAEEEKKTEKRGVVGLGYGGLGYPGFGHGYHGYDGYVSPLGHGLGYPYSGLPLAHGYPAPAPYISKTIAPLAAPLSYHAPLVSKTIAPVSTFGYPGYHGYSSPYLGFGHGVPLLH